MSEATNVSPNILNDLVNRYKIFINDHVSCLGMIAKALDCDIPPLQEKNPSDEIDCNNELLEDFYRTIICSFLKEISKPFLNVLIRCRRV